MSEALTKAPAKTQLSIRDQLQNPSVLQQIQRALPGHMSADRMARVALTAMTRTPKLAECTQASFFKCLLDLSAWGLEPDGRRAHLIPYGKECTLVLDYKGIVELAFRSGYVKSIHSDCVHGGDLFTLDCGKIRHHSPWSWRMDHEKPESQGDVIGAYCIVELKDGASHHEVMTRQEIDGIRKRSKAGNAGPWVSDFSEMAKKTVFRRASKWLPLSAEVQEAFEKDADSLPAIKPQQSKVESVDLSELFEGGATGPAFDANGFPTSKEEQAVK